VFSSIERLETRELLAFSPLGFSLPDLSIDGFAAPVAAWGGPLAVSVDVKNLGASSMVEPFNLYPGAPSTADSGPALVDVFLVKGNPAKSVGFLIGQINVPDVPQNTSLRLSTTCTLPARPPGFPAFGANFNVVFRVAQNSDHAPEQDFTNNAAVAPQPVLLEPPLPDLFAIGLDVPPVMQPGDTIQPNIEIANFGAADSAPQGSFQVLLVATAKRSFTGGFSVLASYTVDSASPLSLVPQTQTVLGDANINLPANIQVLKGANVVLPIFPHKYFLTLVVDPNHSILQIKDLGTAFHGVGHSIRPIVNVGPPLAGLPPAGVLTSPSSPATNPFPDPAFPVTGSVVVPILR